MTLATTETPVISINGHASIQADWTAWLRDAVDLKWRSGEWNPELLLFTTNPDNPSPGAKKCRTIACNALVGGARCQICRTAFRASGTTAEEFDATFIPYRQRSAGGQRNAPCTAARGKCPRENHSTGLCYRHYSAWRAARETDPELPILRWSVGQQPLAPAADCIILGCVHESVIIGLCSSHHRRWKNHWAALGQKSDRDLLRRWAERQAPHLAFGQFSLAPLSDTVRLEFLYGLQRRDAEGRTLHAEPVRFAVKQAAGLPSIALAPDAFDPALERNSGRTITSGRAIMMRFIKREVGQGLLECQGVKPTDRMIWNVRAAGIRSRSSESGKVSSHLTADFGVIRQPWLRDTVMEWASITRPEIADLRARIRSCRISSRTLSHRPGGGDNMADLGFAAMTEIFETFNHLRKGDGTLYSDKNRRAQFRYFTEILDFGRMTGSLKALPAAFSRNSKYHRVRVDVSDEDEIGRALPESVIDQLDAHISLIGQGMSYGAMDTADIHLMFRTAYIMLRDTGRRPAEVARARFDCLARDGDEWQLIWDNYKAKRLGRRLPIFEEEADAIQMWRHRMRELGYPTAKGAHLFPAITGKRHMQPKALARAVRAWMCVIPEIHSEIPDRDGTMVPFDTDLVFPYAFRHSYCQRHADAGVPLDSLMELMDHETANVTRGYYKVSLKRKREAAATMRRHVLDRTGRARAGGTALGYERKSVPAPYGNCEEPTNVKAGGQSCPMRFQCSGCSFYRADPSYLPAIEDEVRRLKASRSIAELTGAAGYIIDGMDGEIRDFSNVVTEMKAQLAALPEDERRAVEEASKALRKSRAGLGVEMAPGRTTQTGRPLLPLTVVSRHSVGDHT
ncbi:tyrosine-type recombinase/integrase [Streptomyces sp. ISL-112]|uniref:tyrosine-type recombinase/integrase n=1 Tax=unclassified Streptomyces TaxID=2593676 RepID=UPI001BEB7363|nr:MULTISPECIES: tyrosine-type recombinase/integrase [unclassified Streptomyces]MBT2430435.1 tyrosine-type recombinase/integrase [Streptomyces sp. ISL-112]MBT2466158.1 tyrosine-type recombinase/integrase [Streptomyces sp. ISL-63]